VCRGNQFGAESGDPEVLACMSKRITPERIEHGVKLVHEVGMQYMVAVLIGTPSETEERAKRTIRLTDRISPTSFDINSYLPMPTCRPTWADRRATRRVSQAG
jgi:radical SAM superfamily enzyme YgiQ (UPF0313 family)